MNPSPESTSRETIRNAVQTLLLAGDQVNDYPNDYTFVSMLRVPMLYAIIGETPLMIPAPAVVRHQSPQSDETATDTLFDKASPEVQFRRFAKRQEGAVSTSAAKLSRRTQPRTLCPARQLAPRLTAKEPSALR